jgi:dTDP-4-dehydrorhamnose reductase
MMGSYLNTVYGLDEIVITDIDELDVRDREQVENAVAKYKPDRIFHLAAETDVDYCEKDPDHAYRTNVIGTLNVALACQKHDIEMVYISTVGVFGGFDKADLYNEFDTPSPVSVYGKTKLEGEQIVRDLLKRFFIVRAGWMMGGGPGKDHKFVSKIVDLIATRDEITVVSDKFGSPTYARQLVANLRLLEESGFYGLYHCVNGGMCSRYEMALEIVRLLGRSTKVKQVNTAHFPLPAPRPRSEAARNYKLELLGMNRMTGWKEALGEYVLGELCPQPDLYSNGNLTMNGMIENVSPDSGKGDL